MSIGDNVSQPFEPHGNTPLVPDWCLDEEDLRDENRRLTEKLRLAMECVEHYAAKECWNALIPRISDLRREWAWFTENGYDHAQKTLKEIEKIK